jgi:hypothetical protein
VSNRYVAEEQKFTAYIWVNIPEVAEAIFDQEAIRTYG